MPVSKYDKFIFVSLKRLRNVFFRSTVIYRPKTKDVENKDNDDSMPMEKVTRSAFESEKDGARADGNEGFGTSDELPLVETSSDHITERKYFIFSSYQMIDINFLLAF